MSETKRDESNLNLSFEDITKLYGIMKAVWPTKLTNVKARFWVKELSLGFECDDKEIGKFRVTVFDRQARRVAYLEGDNEPSTAADIGFNLYALDEGLLQQAFQMMRNLREFDRTSDIAFAKEFGNRHQKLIALVQQVGGANPSS